MDVQVIKQSSLPLSNIARELVGADHGGIGLWSSSSTAADEEAVAAAA